MALLEVKNLKKVYTTRFSDNKVEALKNVEFKVEEGEYVAVMGESGSGKTTLLNILAALDKPTTGEIILDGQNMARINDKAMAAYRRNNLGFVFQDFNLLDTFSNRDNIYFPLVLSRENTGLMEEKITPLAKKLGITTLLDKFPYEISGGQKQRVATARALITEPKLLLADEPTGALDSKSTDDVLKMFKEFNKAGQTIVMVTHSTTAASHAGKVIFIKDGVVHNQIERETKSDNEMYEAITQALSKMVRGGSD